MPARQSWRSSGHERGVLAEHPEVQLVAGPPVAPGDRQQRRGDRDRRERSPHRRPGRDRQLCHSRPPPAWSRARRLTHGAPHTPSADDVPHGPQSECASTRCLVGVARGGEPGRRARTGPGPVAAGRLRIWAVSRSRQRWSTASVRAAGSSVSPAVGEVPAVRLARSAVVSVGRRHLARTVAALAPEKEHGRQSDGRVAWGSAVFLRSARARSPGPAACRCGDRGRGVLRRSSGCPGH